MKIQHQNKQIEIEKKDNVYFIKTELGKQENIDFEEEINIAFQELCNQLEKAKEINW